MTSTTNHMTIQTFEESDMNSLLLAIVEATGDVALLEQYRTYVSDPVDLTDTFPVEARRVLAKLAFNLYSEGEFSKTPVLYEEGLLENLCEAAALRPVSVPEQELILKEMNLLEEAFVSWDTNVSSVSYHDYEVIIAGAGFSGLGLAIQLKNLGIPFRIYERSYDLGGTWAANTYPGCAVDILSHYYSYSFYPKPDWERYYSLQPDVLQYIYDVVDHFGLSEHIYLNHSVDTARFDETTNSWRITGTSHNGEIFSDESRFFVSAVGALSSPYIPDLPGLDSFKGELLHSADWNPEVDLTGKRVALIGNGASGNQIGPRIVDEVKHLTVMTRSPQWVTPAPKYGEKIPESEIKVLRNVPGYARWYRVRSMLAMNDVNRPNAFIEPKFAACGKVSRNNEDLRERLTQYLKSELGDRQDLLEKLLPDFPPVMKRMIRDNGWPRMFRREDVSLVASRAAGAYEDGLIDSEGKHHPLDVVIFATGFKVARMISSIDICGPSGTLRDSWGEDDPRAFLGMTTPDFPNFFVMYGPNTNIGWGGSIVAQGEAQAFHIARVIKETAQHNAKKVAVKSEVYEAYNRELDINLSSVVWSLPIGTTWYRNSKGRVVTNMPWTSLDYWNRCYSAGLESYNYQ